MYTHTHIHNVPVHWFQRSNPLVDRCSYQYSIPPAPEFSDTAAAVSADPRLRCGDPHRTCNRTRVVLSRDGNHNPDNSVACRLARYHAVPYHRDVAMHRGNRPRRWTVVGVTVVAVAAHSTCYCSVGYRRTETGRTRSAGVVTNDSSKSRLGRWAGTD
jgi:hypothetical protein